MDEFSNVSVHSSPSLSPHVHPLGCQIGCQTYRYVRSLRGQAHRRAPAQVQDRNHVRFASLLCSAIRCCRAGRSDGSASSRLHPSRPAFRRRLRVIPSSRLAPRANLYVRNARHPLMATPSAFQPAQVQRLGKRLKFHVQSLPAIGKLSQGRQSTPVCCVWQLFAASWHQCLHGCPPRTRKRRMRSAISLARTRPSIKGDELHCPHTAGADQKPAMSHSNQHDCASVNPCL